MRDLALPLLLIATMLGCGKGQGQADGQSSAQASASAAVSAAPAPTPASPPSAVSSAPAIRAPTVEVALTVVGNAMAFDITKLTVAAGSRVHLTLKNTSTMTTMAHNWVLVKPGTEAAVALANVDKGDAGFIAPAPDVLAFTPLAHAGQTVETTFDAPAVGTYPYVCTFPGHYVIMKGELTVTP